MILPAQFRGVGCESYVLQVYTRNTYKIFSSKTTYPKAMVFGM